MNPESKTIEQKYIDQVAEMRAIKSTRQLSPNTTKDYISAYRKLKSILGEDITLYFNDFEGNTAKIIAFGEKQKNPWKISRVRNLYNAYINLMYAHNVPDETTSKYKLFLKNHQVAYQESQKSNELTSESQIENMITYGELLDYISKLKKETQKDNSPAYYDDVLLILEISKVLPYRINEFAHMKYIENKDYNKLTEDQKNESNWLVKDGWDYFFHFKQYETTKQRPSKIQQIDKPLAKIIRKHFNRYGSVSKSKSMGYSDPYNKPIFIYDLQNNGAYSPEQLSKLMIRVSKEIIGKNVGSAILRKVVVSHKYQATKDQTQEQEAFAKAIGHSLHVENLIYNKNIGE